MPKSKVGCGFAEVVLVNKKLAIAYPKQSSVVDSESPAEYFQVENEVAACVQTAETSMVAGHR